MDRKILSILGDFLILDKWDSIHLKVNVGDRRNEIFITNPESNSVEVEDATPTSQPEPVKTETFAEKIRRFRNAPPGTLTKEEEVWWKERQFDLEKFNLGQITPDVSEEEALRRLAQIGEK